MVLDTAINSIDVYPASSPIPFNIADTPTGVSTVQFQIPTKYSVQRGSLQYTVHFKNTAAMASADKDPALDGENPYNSPGQFIITNYSTESTDLTNSRHTWTIKRIGGAPLDDIHQIELWCKLIAVVGTGGISQVSTGGS